jgi:hypothetical protein
MDAAPKIDVSNTVAGLNQLDDGIVSNMPAMA